MAPFFFTFQEKLRICSEQQNNMIAKKQTITGRKKGKSFHSCTTRARLGRTSSGEDGVG